MNKTETSLYCPLCHSIESKLFHQDKRCYYQCQNCQLVFVPRSQYISVEQEKAMYDLHNNQPNDPGYRRFLNRLLLPMAKELKANSYGLDFGSGPGPTLSIMFSELGHKVTNYDIYYTPDKNVLEQQYDFISSTEVVEHLHYPGYELERLWSCLKPQGVLGLMTKRVIDQHAFKQWHYKHDPTHVCFFSISTFEWLAKKWQVQVFFPEKDVVIFKK